MSRIPAILALVFASLSLAVAARATEPADLVIRSATVIDVRTGRLAPDRAIAVRGGTIIAVVDDRAAGRFQARRTIDARGKFVMPGLWDMHVHFGGGEALVEENKDLLPLYIANGITSVRDCAGDLASQVLAWRDAVARGELFGPTIYTSGPKIEGIKPVWKGTIEIGDRAQADAALDRLQALHVDFVKLTDNTLKPDLFLYAVAQAKKRGLKTSAHIPQSLTLDEAAAAGLSSVEHMDYMIKAGSPDEKAIGGDYAAGRITYAQAFARYLDGFDADRAMADYRRLAARGVAVTPTLNGSRILAYLDRDDHSRDDGLGYIGPGLKATYDWRVERAAKADAAAVEHRHRVYEKSATLLPMLAKAGVPILAGTDSGFLNSYNYPGFGLHDELELYVKSGLTPLQTLQAATLTGPAFLGQADRYGAVAAGKAADILILDENPLIDVRATRSIAGVVVRGRYLDRAALDGLLATARAKVAAAS
jgi:imidazolonepropionase-like amidohydrolase